MDRIDEIIELFGNTECPKEYDHCPMYVAGNDCDNFCPLVETVDMLKELKNRREHDG